MTKSDKIREYFRKHPNAVVADVVKMFDASTGMTYKLRNQVQLESKPMPGLGRKVTLSRAQVEIAQKMGLDPKEYVKAGLEEGVLKYDDERETETGIDETLDERAQDYGKFKDGAALMQGIKRLLADHARAHNKTFADDQWEALEMIVHKMARIVNGNPDKVDSWTDIAGYAKLVADRLQGNVR